MAVVVMFTVHKNRYYRVLQVKCVRALCKTSLFDSKKMCDASWDEYEWGPKEQILIAVNPIQQTSYMVEVPDEVWADWFAAWMDGQYANALVSLEDIEHKEGKPCTWANPIRV